MGILTVSQKEEEIIKNLEKQLSDRLKSNLVSIRLFGSRARGDFHKESDMDILVVLKYPTENHINFIYDTAMLLNYQSNVYLSVKVFSLKELKYYKSIPTLFIQNLLKEGINIY